MRPTSPLLLKVVVVTVWPEPSGKGKKGKASELGRKKSIVWFADNTVLRAKSPKDSAHEKYCSTNK